MNSIVTTVCWPQLHQRPQFIDSGVLPALVTLELHGIPASAAAIDAVREALAKSRAAALP